ncbi:hypothetical protein [Arenimonas sp.]|uniref:hypothetical protein n=1 Tax=Arenimonas sp. TaxID=1872635 RepID=UPI0039E40BC1
MQSIISNIKDPSWWFTVFLVGIIVSIFAGFLKDWIASLIARFSDSFRERRKAKAARREVLFEALANNEIFLVLSMIRLMGLVTISLLLLGIFASVPALVELKEIICAASPAADRCTTALHPLATKALIAATGGLAILTNYRASSRFSLVMEGLRRYRKRRDLPRVV